MKNSIMKVFWIFIGLIVFMVVLSIVLSAVFIPRYAAYRYYGYYGMMGFGWGYGGIFWMSLMMIVPVVLLIFFIIWILGIASGEGWHESEKLKEKSAMDILDERLASGSITKEEYDKIKEELNKK
ncbi:MAG: SHOCT domain-containing protein [Thermoplasmatales archaeon]